jgi:hypothetical protein
MKTAGRLGTRAEVTQVWALELKKIYWQPITSRGFMGVWFRKGSSNFIKRNEEGGEFFSRVLKIRYVREISSRDKWKEACFESLALGFRWSGRSLEG